MDSLFRERRFSSPEGAPMPLHFDIRASTVRAPESVCGSYRQCCSSKLGDGEGSITKNPGSELTPGHQQHLTDLPKAFKQRPNGHHVPYFRDPSFKKSPEGHHLTCLLDAS